MFSRTQDPLSSAGTSPSGQDVHPVAPAPDIVPSSHGVQLSDPTALAKDPGAQSSHWTPPGPKYPTGQSAAVCGTHPELSLLGTSLSSHWLQAEDPSAATSPSWQDVQLSDPTSLEKVPGGQNSHSNPPGPKNPAGHGVGAGSHLEPSSFGNSPSEHTSHSIEPWPDTDPSGHGEHSNAPKESLKVPGGQRSQEMPPLPAKPVGHGVTAVVALLFQELAASHIALESTTDSLTIQIDQEEH